MWYDVIAADVLSLHWVKVEGMKLLLMFIVEC